MRAKITVIATKEMDLDPSWYSSEDPEDILREEEEGINDNIVDFICDDDVDVDITVAQVVGS